VDTRELGRSGVRVPALGFGCGPNAGLMVGPNDDLQETTVARAVDLGLTYFDTAAAYGDGASERNLGRAIKRLGIRPIISSKFLLEEAHLGDIRGSLRRSVQNSLDRLGVDHLDVLVMHNRVAWRREPGSIVGIGPLLSIDDVLGDGGLATGFDELRSSGLVRSFGLTGFGGESSAIDHLLRSQIFDCVNAEFHLANPTAGYVIEDTSGLTDYRSLIDRAANARVGTMVIRVFGGGQLAGRGEQDVRSSRILRWLKSEDLDVIDTALRFALAKPGVSTVIVGFSHPDHVDQAVASLARGPLPRDVTAMLDRVIAALPAAE
jgi:aryl-alcohol dehydrogenase-like predicted oxidoreductase